MKYLFFVVILTLLANALPAEDQNPLYQEYMTPFQTPPFDLIKEVHFMPAFLKAIQLHQQEMDAIVNNPKPATFANTIEKLEYSGELLSKVRAVFFNLTSAHTNDNLQKIAKEATPLLSKHHDDILLNAKLFNRIKTVYRQRQKLTTEQKRLVEEYYKDFVRSGADLGEKQKSELREINQRLSALSLQFGDNVLKEDNGFVLIIDQPVDLAGLPDNVKAAAMDAARERNLVGKWAFTLHKPSLLPFLQYSEKRDLREKMYKAYINRGDNNNSSDNKVTLSQIASLRVARANLLGFRTHADYVLAENMAKTPDKVYGFLQQVWPPALNRAREEIKDMQSMIQQEGGSFQLAPWDWWYYADKVKKAKYDLDEESLRPFFKLENVIQGVFMVANKLYGITLTERTDIPKYHPDVRVFEVKEANGDHIGILYTDYFPRSSKRGGAWMNEFRGEYKKQGKKITPLICNVGNFSKPTGDTPSLLSLDEVSTLFHEFGHALHGLLSDVRYEKLSNVPRDFVELPSQIMENWAFEPEVLKMYARHFLTNDPIPNELVDKMHKARHFNQGFETVEYLAASFLDMDWHTLSDTSRRDANRFEEASMQKIGLMPEIVPRYRSPNFRHIFSGGYSSGYYSYLWAEVLDTDAFSAFKETSLFDQKTALAFRKNILEAGASQEAMTLYKNFRGREPQIEGLLKKRGLVPGSN
jgi:peptidyl-dipeptidase Dcp